MTSIQQVTLNRIANTPKGEERAELLKNDRVRSNVLNSGANVTIYTGEVKEGKTISDMLADVYVGRILRKNRKGNSDGLGALGGLAERTSEDFFASLDEKQRKMLVGQKDDVVEVDGKIVLTNDIDVIRKNNVLRELREELEDLGIKGVNIDKEKLELIPMPKVKDDNFMINIWDGKGECFAVNPYCHVYKNNDGLLERLSSGAHEKDGGEARTFMKISLIDALTAYGNKGVEGLSLEDGRHAVKDHRYPHEYLTLWALASKLLDYDSEKMIALSKEVREKSDHPISFSMIAKATGQSLDDLAGVLRLPVDTVKKMNSRTSIGQNNNCATRYL